MPALQLLEGFMRPGLAGIIVADDQAAYLQLVDPQFTDMGFANAEPANGGGSNRDRPNRQRPKSGCY